MAWMDYSLIEADQMTAGDKKVKLDDGCLGFCPVWKSKAAARRAGVKNTNNFRKVKYVQGK